MDGSIATRRVADIGTRVGATFMGAGHIAHNNALGITGRGGIDIVLPGAGTAGTTTGISPIDRGPGGGAAQAGARFIRGSRG
jgi:hypothetical protein